MIDIGVNLTNKRFSKDIDKVIQRAEDSGVQVQIVTGTHLNVSQQALQLSLKYPQRLYSTAGVHPHHADEWNEAVANDIAQLLEHNVVVAAGECGLDYNRNFSTPENQRHCFAAQLDLAVQAQKPVFLHERDAHEDFYAILEKYRDRIPGAVVHCFTGTQEQLQAYLSMDCHIGITGWICDARRGHHMHEFLGQIPDHRILVETDAPFLLPKDMQSKPKNNRNEPAFLPHIVETLAKIRNQSVSELQQLTLENSQKFFSIS